MNRESSAKPILLVCNTRTGSTAFGTALARSNPDIAFYGEAFHTGGVNLRTSFLFWVKENNISAQQFQTHKIEICRNYLRSRTAGRGKKAVVFGVKYHDLLNLMPVPSLHDFPPDLFAALRQLDGGIIHLLRRSRFDSTISAIIAQRRQVFHMQVGDQIPRTGERINISISNVTQQVRMRVVQEMIVSKQIQNSNCRNSVVVYEDIFGEKRSPAMRELAALIGFDVKLDNVAHQKIGTNYSSIIDNFDELAEAARGWERKDWSIGEI